MSFRPTALGRVFLITPPLADGAPWLLHRFSLAGNWRGCSLHATRADAAKHRRYLFRHHARLAAERAAADAERVADRLLAAMTRRFT